MDKSKFRISDNEKADILFDLINPNFNEEGNWELNAFICDVYDDYCLCRSKDGFMRVYYTKEGDNITIGESIAVKIVDVSETEYAALETMKAIGGSFETAATAYSEAITKVDELTTENSNFAAKQTELEAKIAEFENVSEEVLETTDDTSVENIENEPIVENSVNEEESTTENSIDETKEENPVDFSAKIEALEAEKVEMEKKISDITNENESLLAFKKAIEKTQKEEILNKYEEYLSESAITEFTNSMDNYSVEDFEKEVCVIAVKSDSSIFANKHNEPNMYFKGGNTGDRKTVESPAARLINNYKNGGNK